MVSSDEELEARQKRLEAQGDAARQQSCQLERLQDETELHAHRAQQMVMSLCERYQHSDSSRVFEEALEDISQCTRRNEALYVDEKTRLNHLQRTTSAELEGVMEHRRTLLREERLQ